MEGRTRPALCDGQGHEENQVRRKELDEGERKGHVRVVETLVLAAGEAIKIVLDSLILPTRSGKLYFFPSQYGGRRGRATGGFKAHVVAKTPTRECGRDLRDSLSPAHCGDAAHATRAMRTYMRRYSSGA